jgi:hypothetical protein
VRIRPHPFFPGFAEYFNGITVRRNRVILASKLGRALTEQDLAHHCDESHDNDTPENIELMSPAAHNRHHKLGSTRREDTKEQISATLKRLYADGIRVNNLVPRGGENNSRAKLTQVQANEIRASLESSAVLSPRYGVSPRRIRAIKQGVAYK